MWNTIRPSAAMTKCWSSCRRSKVHLARLARPRPAQHLMAAAGDRLRNSVETWVRRLHASGSIRAEPTDFSLGRKEFACAAQLAARRSHPRTTPRPA